MSSYSTPGVYMVLSGRGGAWYIWSVGKVTKVTNSANVNKVDIEKVASLARLPLTGREKDGLALQIQKIVDYFQEIQEVDTSGVEPTFNLAELNTVSREDNAETIFTQDEALINASGKKNGFFVTKK